MESISDFILVILSHNIRTCKTFKPKPTINNKMNNLASVSKILYDRDVIEINKENFELKKKLKIYETPKVLYEDEDELEEIKNKEFSKLEIEIKEWSSNINFNYFEYEFDSIWYKGPYDSLKKCLLNLTNNIEWSEFNADYIICMVEKCLQNLFHFNISNDNLSENLSDMVYGMIIGRLDGDGSEPLLLEIPYYKNSIFKDDL